MLTDPVSGSCCKRKFYSFSVGNDANLKLYPDCCNLDPVVLSRPELQVECLGAQLRKTETEMVKK